jgi:hypothetical protein
LVVEVVYLRALQILEMVALKVLGRGQEGASRVLNENLSKLYKAKVTSCQQKQISV